MSDQTNIIPKPGEVTSYNIWTVTPGTHSGYTFWKTWAPGVPTDARLPVHWADTATPPTETVVKEERPVKEPEPTNVVLDQGVDVVVTEDGDVELVPSEPAAAPSRIGGQNRFGVTGGNTLTPSRDRVLDRPAGTDPVFRPSAHAQRSIAEGERLKAARRAAVERRGRLIKAGVVALACLAVAAHGPLLLAARALRAWLGGVLVLALVLGSGCTSAQAQADLAAVEADVHAGLAYADEGLTWASGNAPQIVAAVQAAAAKDPSNKLLQSVATKAVTAINAGDLTTAKALVHAGSVATASVGSVAVAAPVTSGQ
jgi:hypothetical protein